MAHCVITTLNTGTRTCMVHRHPNPCPRDGEPAWPEPLHMDDRWGRTKAVAHWVTVTGQQRPLVLHQGNLDSKRPTHQERDCWCHPEYVSAQESV